MHAESSTARNNITLTEASTKTNQFRTSLRIYFPPNLPPLDTRQKYHANIKTCNPQQTKCTIELVNLHDGLQEFACRKYEAQRRRHR